MVYGVTEFVVNATPVVSNEVIKEAGWRTMYGGDHRTTSGVNVNEASALGYAPFWRAVNLISGDVAGMPCDIYKRQRDGGKKYADTHPAAPLLRDMASPWWRADECRRVLTSHALVHGNGYAPITRDMMGNPIALGLIDPNGVMIRIMDDGQKWYIWYEEGKAVRVPARDMLHIKGLGRNGLIGYSIIELMANALGVGMAAQEFGGRLFSNGANMSGLLMVPGHFSEEKIRNTMAAWNSMQTGLNQSHKVALLQDGVKFQQLSMAPEQTQFLQTREFEVRQTVSNITGVPPHMLGDSTRTSHNSLESESQNYLARCLNPWLKEWEQEFRCKLLSEKERIKDTHCIEFNREAEIQMEFEKKISGIYRQIECGVMTRNEARNLLNMARITDKEDGGDNFYHPANWIVAGEEIEAAHEAASQQPMKEPLEEDEPVTPEYAAATMLRAMVTSSVTEAIKIERTRVVQRAGMQADKFTVAVEEFYETWTDNTAPGMSNSSARLAIISHAEASKKMLFDVHAVSTVGSLKANVQDVVASWDKRAENLITELLKGVK
jgi:HK97 family phage portal protein